MSEPGTLYWSVVQPIWDRVSIYEPPPRFLSQLADVSQVQRTLFVAHWCHSEVCNGGFHQFFSNPTGILAPEAALAYEAIGLPEAGALLRQAIAFFGIPYPRARSERQALLAAVPGTSREQWDPFYHLDDEYYELLESKSFDLLADAYARAHGPAPSDNAAA